MGVACTPQQLGQYISKVKDARERACPRPNAGTPPLLLNASWWTETMFNAFRHMRPGRAASDGIPHELRRAGGLPATALYGQLAATTSGSPVQAGIPLAWRGGRPAAAPRKKHAPLSAANVQGVLVAPAPTTAYSSALRALLAFSLSAFLGAAQEGAVPRGGTEFVLMTARLAFAPAQSEGVSCAVLVVDIKQAFRSAIIAFTLGPLSLQSVLRVVLSNFASHAGPNC